MNTGALQTSRAKLLILIYLVGIILQGIYLPYQARHGSNILAVSIDAGYSWVWDRPVFFDEKKNVNVSLAEVEAVNARTAPSQPGLFSPLDKFFADNDKQPSSWVQIYGIDYKRLLLTLTLWSVVMGGLLFVMKKKDMVN